MRAISIIWVFAVLLSPHPAANAEDCTARQVLDCYFSLPCPDFDPMDGGRAERLDALHRLWKRPKEATEAIGDALPEVTERVHRLELIETLGRLRTPGSADIVIPYLYDADVGVRLQALKAIRLMASRIRRAGVVNVSREPEFPPAVDGLLPLIVEAAQDEDARIRGLALWALADTREPEAADELRRHLQDPNAGLRFQSACLLAEFGDDSGLPELGRALDRISRDRAETAGTFYADAQHLFVSLERVTGVSMGAVPMVPWLASSFVRMEQLREEYDALLEAWVRWWADRDGKAPPEAGNME